MAYNYPEPLKRGERYVSYPHYYKRFIKNEKRFKEYLEGYLKTNEPTSKAVGVTKDHRLVCIENPDNTLLMVQARRDEKKKKKGAKKK